MIIRDSILIKADIGTIWEIFTDLTCWKDWSTVISFPPDKQAGIKKGGRLQFCMRPFALPLSLEAKVEELVPAARIVWSARKFGVLARHEFLFEELPDGVRVPSIETFAGFRLALACFRLGKSRLRSLTSLLLDELKKASETAKPSP